MPVTAAVQAFIPNATTTRGRGSATAKTTATDAERRRRRRPLRAGCRAFGATTTVGRGRGSGGGFRAFHSCFFFFAGLPGGCPRRRHHGQAGHVRRIVAAVGRCYRLPPSLSPLPFLTGAEGDLQKTARGRRGSGNGRLHAFGQVNMEITLLPEISSTYPTIMPAICSSSVHRSFLYKSIVLKCIARQLAMYSSFRKMGRTKMGAPSQSQFIRSLASKRRATPQDAVRTVALPAPMLPFFFAPPALTQHVRISCVSVAGSLFLHSVLEREKGSF